MQQSVTGVVPIEGYHDPAIYQKTQKTIEQALRGHALTMGCTLADIEVNWFYTRVEMVSNGLFTVPQHIPCLAEEAAFAHCTVNAELVGGVEVGESEYVSADTVVEFFRVQADPAVLENAIAEVTETVTGHMDHHIGHGDRIAFGEVTNDVSWIHVHRRPGTDEIQAAIVNEPDANAVLVHVSTELIREQGLESD